MLETGNSLTLEDKKVQDYFSTLRTQSFPARRLPERVVSAVWFDAAFDQKNLCTNDLRKLEIISPGRWNEGPGPDFLDAEIKISGTKKLIGDVEIEVFTSDWDRHYHKKSVDYGNVILRVCLWNDINKPLKSKIPLLVLSPFISDIKNLKNYSTEGYPFASPAMVGPCQQYFRITGTDELEKQLETLGRKRLELKAYRFGMLARTFGKDQTIYKGIMEALGYGMNQDPMSRLADAVNVEYIYRTILPLPKDQRQKALEAALFAHCGAFSDPATLEQNEHIGALNKIWQTTGISHSPVIIDGFRLARTRPANNPFRRLAAISHLLTEIPGFNLYRFFEKSFDPPPAEFDGKWVINSLLNSFLHLKDDYWQEHSGTNPTPLKKPMALIGNGLATTIIANIILPLALGTMERKENIWKVAELLTGMPHNQKTRFACVRILGPTSAQPPLARKLLINQGLIQVFEDHCKHLHPNCPTCKMNRLS